MPLDSSLTLPGNFLLLILPLLFFGLSFYLREKVFKTRSKANFMAYLNIAGGIGAACAWICFLVLIKPHTNSIADFIAELFLWVVVPSIIALFFGIIYAIRFCSNKVAYYVATGFLTFFFYWLIFTL